jgi:hypothetical protein
MQYLMVRLTIIIIFTGMFFVVLTFDSILISVHILLVTLTIDFIYMLNDVQDCDEDFFWDLETFTCIENSFCCDNCLYNTTCCFSIYLNETSAKNHSEKFCLDTFEKYYSFSDKYL